MSVTFSAKAVIWMLLCCGVVAAQVSSTAPKHWKSGSPVGLGSSGFELDRELRDTVRREILDTSTVRLIAQSVRLTEHERTLLLVAPGPVEEEVWLYTLGDEWGEGCSRFAERLGAYVLARLDGHTRACLLLGMTNRPSISDPDLKILSANHPLLPISWFRKAESGTTTNKAGQVASRSMTATMVDGKMQLRTNHTHIPIVDEVCRWVCYNLVDGDVGWRYVVSFKVDGTLEHIDVSKLDAKELDPSFQAVIKEVDSEVASEIRQSGTLGQFGSVRTYWRLKKEKLKSKGIDWRSPGELNRGRIYD